MIDHLLGRPSTSLKRLQILFIILIWSTVLKVSDRNGPRNFTFLRRLNRFGRRFTPWQIVVSILTFIYAVKHLDSLLGFGAPEPLARMYSRPFYRVTWIVTALDAGFATAMNIQPKWLRDIASLLFSFYYLIYAQEADEKLRKFRAFCTVDMMRATWHKTTNPYIRLVTWFHRPSLGIAREILLPRPKIGPHNKRPTKAWLFYNGSEKQLREELELVLDFPGGGFVCMTPQHHEERLRQLAKEMGKPVLSIDYGKSPEYIFPYALEECFDVYRSLIESNGKIIGMGMVDDKISSNEKEDVGEAKKIKIILSGDSAGGNLATSVMFKIIEYPQPFIRTAYSNLKSNSQTPEGYGISPLPRPIAMLLAYPSLNFEFTAWMKPDHLRVLRVQSEVNLQSLKAENHQSRSSSIKPVEASKEGASAGDEKDSAKTSSKGLSPTRSVSATRSRSRSRRPSLSSPIALLSPKDERSRESVMIASVQESAKGKGRSDHASSSKSNEDSNRPGVERQKSYLSLAGQAQMHLFERARFAEAEDQNDDTSLTRDQANISQQDPNLSSVVDDSYTFDLSRSSSRSGSEYGGTSRWLGRIEGDEVDKTIRSLNDPDFELELKAQNDLEKAQITLAKARELADELTRKRSKGKSGIVKTRLTMTSMSAYYSDRILTQSMMRAMAILYIGGRRQPQFEEDYLLSPIVAPARLLAELPPILFICGEKDPICDDTVVMAGRIREAKLAKQFDLKRRREGASARFGESLRLSSSNQSGIPRDPIEDEEPEDWVQMKILEGWSHGFLQMSSLLPESKQVISFLASWTKETFEDSAERFRELEEEKKITKRKGEKSSNSKKGLGKKVDQKLDGERKGIEASSQQSKSEARSTTEIQNRIEVPISSSTDYQVNQKSINARSDVEDDDDEPLSFKTRRSPVQKHLEISNSSPRVTSSTTPTQSNLIQNGAKSTTDPIAQDPESSIISSSPLQSATVSKLRDQSRSRPRPSSFSKVESRKNSSSILQQNSRPSSIKINLDQESSDEEGPSSMIINQDSLTPSSPTFKRRLSLDSTSNNANGRKFSNGNNDDSSSPSDQYKKLLVEENTLLQRRRFGVANELGQSSSAVHSDDDEDEDRGERDGEDGEGD